MRLHFLHSPDHRDLRCAGMCKSDLSKPAVGRSECLGIGGGAGHRESNRYMPDCILMIGFDLMLRSTHSRRLTRSDHPLPGRSTPVAAGMDHGCPG
jgi:hypothetical protein